MPQRPFVFEKLLPYHIINRGVDQRSIFLEQGDYYRFIFQIYAANFGSPAYNLYRKDVIQAARNLLGGRDIPKRLIIEEHPPLVDILNFALMPNHIHFNLAQRVEGGISQFMHKLSCGFARYFNAKYERVGTLFQGRFKAIPITGEEQLRAVTRYINVNPLDLFQKDWKQKGLKEGKGALKFLRDYQWSSYPDFIGVRCSHLVPPKEILKMFYGKTIPEDEKEYQKFIEHYLIEHGKESNPLFLEEAV